VRTQGCNRRTATVPAQRITRILVVAAVAGCSSVAVTADTNLAPPSSIPTTALPSPSPTTFAFGDLAHWESIEVLVGATPLTVALADEEFERQQGLAGVTDLGDFEGMLFAWEDEVTTGFWMKDTPIALDLLFFDAAGAIVDQTSLEPCQAEPCPVFVADGLFRWVLEAPAGSLEATGKLSFPEAD
jgi:uncharacterized membrane protein (UPF0127 family)